MERHKGGLVHRSLYALGVGTRAERSDPGTLDHLPTDQELTYRFGINSAFSTPGRASLDSNPCQSCSEGFDHRRRVLGTYVHTTDFQGSSYVALLCGIMQLRCNVSKQFGRSKYVIFAKKRVNQVEVKNDGQLRLATTFNIHLTL